MENGHNHNYFRNEDNKIECRTCGLLKTTIEGVKNDPTTADDTIDRDLLPSIIETTERIVIDYANLTGRETESRAEFRALVYSHLKDFLFDYTEEIRKIIEGEIYGMKGIEECGECTNSERLKNIMGFIN